MGAGCLRGGWIYALRSDNTPLIKIGLTTTSPFQRVRELNASANYGPIGPWQPLHLKQVKDTQVIESAIHRQLADKKSVEIASTRELFSITPNEARNILDEIPDADLSRPAPVNKLKLQPDFISYLTALFQYSGLRNYRHLEESWTFSLFPTTAGGRFFTINIDRHEVAFSQMLKDEEEWAFHAIIVDQMVTSDRALKKWLKSVDGWIEKTPYPSNWGNSRRVCFKASFDEALGLFQLPSFRRALIAYWYEALLRMEERQTRSLFARFHNYDATSEIFRHLSEMEKFRNKIEPSNSVET